MSEMFRTFSDRVLEGQSLRSLFLWLLAIVFALGISVGTILYEALRQHRFNWSFLLSALMSGVVAFVYARILYSRLSS